MAGVNILMLLSGAVQVFLFISGFLYSRRNVLQIGPNKVRFLPSGADSKVK
jgi:hypothetical protein